ncbi:MAG: hypothetical protein HYS17_04330 [Micavibrio aeruginosavorus]|uniref:Uncharacterized protein n=1 Tax=Micavibrio aeruginosavorus TaxID=349221 RepID=A0A7T5UI13_9BACT|nr:MAG: hypothetical protein HYS17_04330 [Micavibrio aeruginosavorus]
MAHHPSDAEELDVLHQYRILNRSLYHLNQMQQALRQVFQTVVGSQWTPFSVKTLQRFVEKPEWDMITSNPVALGGPALARVRQEADECSRQVGELLLKRVGLSLAEVDPVSLRDGSKVLSRLDLAIEEISGLMGGPDGARADAAQLQRDLEDIVNRNAPLTAAAARRYGYELKDIKGAALKLQVKKGHIDVASWWTKLSTCDLRAMKTALMVDYGLASKGAAGAEAPERCIAQVSAPQKEFIRSDARAFTGLGRAKSSLYQALNY